jgi:hypothetical protein
MIRFTAGYIPHREEAEEEKDMTSYPVYILRLGDKTVIVAPQYRQQDVGHTEFWESTVARIVARHFRIPVEKLLNLPYCQSRARVVGNTVYFGGRHDPNLLEQIRAALGNPDLSFAYDNHERRLREDVHQFRRLVKRYGR